MEKLLENTAKYADAQIIMLPTKLLSPKLFGGFGTNIQAYGVDFGINFSYQVGGKQYDGTYARLCHHGQHLILDIISMQDLLKSWTAENPSKEIPRFMFGDTYSTGSSTRF